MKITLCPADLKGMDIPTYEFKDYHKELVKIDKLVHDFICTDDGKAYVCFQNWRDSSNYEDEHVAILVSHDYLSIDSFMVDNFEGYDSEDIDFSIFSFNSYEEAFKYCIDLKEGL